MVVIILHQVVLVNSGLRDMFNRYFHIRGSSQGGGEVMVHEVNADEFDITIAFRTAIR